MNILALDTSTRLLGVGVLSSTGESASDRFDDDGHSAPLFSRVEQILGEAGLSRDEIDFLAVVNGPGSFTGLRIGMSGLLGWAEASNIPVQAIDSFHAMRVSIPPKSYPALIVIYARAEEFYFQIAHAREDYSEPFVGEWKNAAERLKSEVAVVGPGAERLMKICGSENSELLKWDGIVLSGCDMISVCREAKKMYDCDGESADNRRIEPFYMTLSQAQINFEKRERRL